MDAKDTIVAAACASDMSVNRDTDRESVSDYEPRARNKNNGGIHKPPSENQPRFDAITRAVCARFFVKFSDITGKSRVPPIPDARHTLIYVTRKLLGWSYPRLGHAAGFKDHTTALSAMRKIEAYVAKDPEWKRLIDGLIERIEADFR